VIFSLRATQPGSRRRPSAATLVPPNPLPTIYAICPVESVVLPAIHRSSRSQRMGPKVCRNVIPNIMSKESRGMAYASIKNSSPTVNLSAVNLVAICYCGLETLVGTVGYPQPICSFEADKIVGRARVKKSCEGVSPNVDLQLHGAL
jgi:hypothetical protein